MTMRCKRLEQVVVFDLDDTLYLEWTYARSGFSAVSQWVQTELGIEGFDHAAWREFQRGERLQVFDCALAALGRVPDPATIAKMVEIYRGHSPQIELADDVEAWLGSERTDIGIALISDGFLVAQSRKAEALRLAERGFDPIVLTDIWGRDYWKPHARAYAMVEEHFALPPERMAYVADNPGKDFVTPRARGWRTIQIKRPDRMHRGEAANAENAAEFEIEEFGQLDAALARPQLKSGRTP